MDWKSKLSSRKFWLCVAAFLGSVATSISGIVTDNHYVTTIGVVAGDKVVIVADGNDEDKALSVLVELIESGFKK